MVLYRLALQNTVISAISRRCLLHNAGLNSSSGSFIMSLVAVFPSAGCSWATPAWVETTRRSSLTPCSALSPW